MTCIWTHSAYHFESNNCFIYEFKGKTLYIFLKHKEHEHGNKCNTFRIQKVSLL